MFNQKSIGFLKLFFNFQILDLFNCSSFFRHYADKGAIVSYKVHVYYPCLFHFQLCTCLMTAKEDSPVRLSLLDSFSAAFKI